MRLKIKQMFRFLQDTLEDLFLASLIVYLIFMLLETLKKGFVSFFVNIGVIEVIVLISGALALLSRKGPERTSEVTNVITITKTDLRIVIILAIINAAIIFKVALSLGGISYFVSATAGLAIAIAILELQAGSISENRH